MPPGIWEQALKMGPAYAALLAIGWGGFKACVFLGKRLFDSETGLLTVFFKNLNANLAAASANHESLVRMMDQSTQAVHRVERRLSAAASAALSPAEMDSLAQLLLDELPVPLAQSSEDGHHMRANEAFRDLTGYTSEELRGLTFGELTPGKGDLAADVEACRQLVTGDLKTFRLEKRITRKDGSEIYVALYCFRFPQTGPFRFFMSCMIPLHPPHTLR